MLGLGLGLAEKHTHTLPVVETRSLLQPCRLLIIRSLGIITRVSSFTLHAGVLPPERLVPKKGFKPDFPATRCVAHPINRLALYLFLCVCVVCVRLTVD